MLVVLNQYTGTLPTGEGGGMGLAPKSNGLCRWGVICSPGEVFPQHQTGFNSLIESYSSV